MMSTLIGWVFDRVMAKPLARFDAAVRRPFATQEEGLRRILTENAATDFGRRHGFARFADSQGADLWREFRRAVPIRRYDDFLPDIRRMQEGEAGVLVPGRPEMFSLTSGTTSEPKFCPVTRAFIREHHRQHLLWMYHVYTDHPRVNDGKYLVVASPAEMGRTAGDIPYGAMSGKQLEVQSVPVRRRMAAPARIQHLENAEDRWFNLLLFALAEENLRVVTSVNPSTLVALANRLARDADRLLDALEHGHPAAADPAADATSRLVAHAFRPNPARAAHLREILRGDGQLTPAAVWPELALLLTWQGGSSSFYLPHVATLWGNVRQRCLGLRASEGTFSIPLRDHTPSGVLAVGGHVMEFVPAAAGDPGPSTPTLLAGQLQEGELYRLIATTSGGFYRYDLGDLVRVTGFHPRTPVVAFERRAGAVLSATGEKLTEDQVVGAMEIAAADGPLMNGFSLTWEMDDGVVRYVLALECTGSAEAVRNRFNMIRSRVQQLLAIFDDELMYRNVEYQSKRDDGRIAFPRAVLLAEGSYEALRSRLAAEGKPENQIKHPVLVTPPGPGRAPVAGCRFFDGMTIAAEF
ncbi:MAG: GH3 auxin-responsive promoter family protein [Planctomycetes bacterium]|nr:GH3 auxin-responsive promoter family protein [Planctomycetota bacterium]